MACIALLAVGAVLRVAQTPVPAGRVAPFVAYDSAYQRPRRLWVYTPPGFSAAAPTSYPLIVAFERPDLFGNVWSQSGAFWRGAEASNGAPYEWLTAQVRTGPKQDVKFVLDVGALEDHPTLGGSGPNFLQAHRRFADALRARGYDVTATEVPGGNHAPQWWRQRLAFGIRRSRAAGRCPTRRRGISTGFREPSGGIYVHRGREALRQFLAAILAGGGIHLEHCSLIDDGVVAAIEFNALQFGNRKLEPQAGLAIYERGATGRLAAARIYDDVNVEALAPGTVR